MHSRLLFALSCLQCLPLVACGKGRTSEADCTAFANHFVELAGAAGPSEADATQSRQVAESMKTELQQRCIDRGTAQEVECARKAATLAEFQACGTVKPG